VPEKQDKIVIDLNQLQAQAAALEQLIQGYQEVLQRLEEARISLQMALETLKALEEAEGEMLVPADRVGAAYFFGKPERTDEVLVHLGLDVYAALPPDEASNRLAKKLADVEQDITRISEQLEQAVQQYEAIMSILSQAAAAAMAKAQQPRS